MAQSGRGRRESRGGNFSHLTPFSPHVAPDSSYISADILFFEVDGLAEGFEMFGAPFDAILDLGNAGTAANWAALATVGVYPEDPTLDVDELAKGIDGDNIPVADVACELLSGRPARSRRIEMSVADLPIFTAIAFGPPPLMILGLDAIAPQRAAGGGSRMVISVSEPGIWIEVGGPSSIPTMDDSEAAILEAPPPAAPSPPASLPAASPAVSPAAREQGDAEEDGADQGDADQGGADGRDADVIRSNEADPDAHAESQRVKLLEDCKDVNASTRDARVRMLNAVDVVADGAAELVPAAPRTMTRWLADWHARFECWWVLSPYSDGLHACLGALSLHVARRFELWRSGARAMSGASKRGTDGAPTSEAGCEWVQLELDLELPPFPELGPHERDLFQVPPLPRLIPAWERLHTLLGTQPQLAMTRLETPAVEMAWATAGAGAGFGVALVLFALATRRSSKQSRLALQARNRKSKQHTHAAGSSKGCIARAARSV